MTHHYQKRKNTELFKDFVNPNLLNVETPQNYIPIYNTFFNLNNTNYNSINFNNRWHLERIENADNNPDTTNIDNLFVCKLKTTDNTKQKRAEVFFKMAPLIDPFKYVVGKCLPNAEDTKWLTRLPQWNSTKEDCVENMLESNNAAYVDGLFVFLSSKLKENYNFVHGIDCYGSFLAVKKNFKLNVIDDIDYLHKSHFFRKQNGKLFVVEDYSSMIEYWNDFENAQEEEQKRPPIHICSDEPLETTETIAVDVLQDELFDEVFEENRDSGDSELRELSEENVAIHTEETESHTNNVSLKSDDSCSSRSSHTESDTEIYSECSGSCNCEDCESDAESEVESNVVSDDDSNAESNAVSDDDSNAESNAESDAESNAESNDEEPTLFVTIPKFPVQIIAMEHFEKTLDWLMSTHGDELTIDEWLSILMQIIMTLIAYQKVFSFTHNDLHTSNIMYVNAPNIPYLFYKYNGITYKVPTFGRIFKIIDFGRSIYKYNGTIFCSDSFKEGGDAESQYNCEPFFNQKKPRLDPNFSFDLCRLACSMYDLLDDEELDLDPIKIIVNEWCLDDNGLHMLYKQNGVERYADFKLYKMIARCVHKHTPQAQLERPEFKSFKCNHKEVNTAYCVDIDAMPVLT